MESDARRFAPGDIAPQTGKYLELAPGQTRGREVTVLEGEAFPPPTSTGATYSLLTPMSGDTIEEGLQQ